MDFGYRLVVSTVPVGFTVETLRSSTLVLESKYVYEKENPPQPA